MAGDRSNLHQKKKELEEGGPGRKLARDPPKAPPAFNLAAFVAGSGRLTWSRFAVGREGELTSGFSPEAGGRVKRVWVRALEGRGASRALGT